MYGIIYKITNLINSKIYIGQTIKKMQIRWKEHQSAAKRGINTYFHKAIRKYGIENFVIEQIAEANSKQELDELELTQRRISRACNGKYTEAFGYHWKLLKE